MNNKDEAIDFAKWVLSRPIHKSTSVDNTELYRSKGCDLLLGQLSVTPEDLWEAYREELDKEVYTITTASKGYNILVSTLHKLGIVVPTNRDMLTLVIQNLGEYRVANPDPADFHPCGGVVQEYEYTLQKFHE